MGSIINGITGTTNYYKAEDPNIAKQDFSGNLTGSQNTINSNISSEQDLANQQAQIANGTKNNVAQSQYQQNVDQNAQAAAGAIANQKGQNIGLAGRLATNEMANANQNAAGTEATNQMSQQNQALNNQASLYNNIGTQAQSNNATTQTAQANQNSAINSGVLGTNQVNAGVSAGNQTQNAATTSGLMNGSSAAVASMLADGGMVDNSIPTINVPQSVAPAPQSSAPQAALSSGGGSGGGSGAGLMSLLALLAKGGQVPGHAPMPGNNYANDTHPALLSAKEVVLPRSVTLAKNSPEKAKEFMASIKAQQNPSTPEATGFSKVLESHRNLAATLARIESKLKGKK